ncbi:hypothetical protein GCM10012275_56370 [Longimycelium tulufanense]|uniref:Siphovirus-type tail component C-terminal domain-containing protein n=1 Tax=Longimycelium tulufanense TaxID=907463 RepID=A0A8J3FXC3_9PSEU|nr:phage tail family protein [Longimycelium tulufanense]GGM78463.1 hypothetical protein GCM10012275_56370 [Longimycelium tulufanense]
MPWRDWTARYNGLLLGEGTPYDLIEIAGLLDAPEVRTADKARLQRPGMILGRDVVGGRTVTLTVEVWGRDVGEFESALTAFVAAFTPARPLSSFRFLFPGVAGGALSEVDAVVRRRSVPMRVPDYLYQRAECVVELWCPEPRIFSPPQTAVAGPPEPAPGVRFPLRFPVRFPTGRSASGAATVLNTGNAPTDVQVRLVGPVPSPRIINYTTGQVLALDLNLGENDFLDVDFGTRTVLLNGTASRYASLLSRPAWWELEPGQPTRLGYRAAVGYQPGRSSHMQITWRSATL